MKIVVMDWGIGGVPCARALQAACPQLDLIYVADSGHVPYGQVSRRRLADRISSVLRGIEPDVAILACNAASSVLSEVSAEHPVEGLVSHAVAMALEAPPGLLGVLAGDRVIADETYARPLREAGTRR